MLRLVVVELFIHYLRRQTGITQRGFDRALVSESHLLSLAGYVGRACLPWPRGGREVREESCELVMNLSSGRIKRGGSLKFL